MINRMAQEFWLHMFGRFQDINLIKKLNNPIINKPDFWLKYHNKTNTITLVLFIFF
jgi:hypothetical protein